jgi:hypothetical protein
VKKGQPEEKNILKEKGSVPRKQEKIKRLKNLENNVVSSTSRLTDPYTIMASKSEDYDYLLSFFKPPYNLTRGGKAETLLANRVPVMKSYHIISEKSPKDLWREDLAKLSEILPEPASSEAKPTKSSTKKKSRQDSEDEMFVSKPTEDEKKEKHRSISLYRKK